MPTNPDTLANLVVHFDAGTISQSDNTALASWTPSAGAETAPATQAASGSRPTYRTARINGLPAVVFTAAGTSNMDTGAWGTSYGRANTAFVVGKMTSGGSVGGAGNYFTGRSGVLNYLGQEADNVRIGAGAAAQMSWPHVPDANFHIYAAVYNGGSSAIYFDSDTAVLTGTTGTGDANESMPGMRIGSTSSGGANYPDAEICEIIFFHRALTSSEITGVMQFLNSKYALGLSIGPVTGAVAGSLPRPSGALAASTGYVGAIAGSLPRIANAPGPRNLCTNPSAKNDLSDWGNGSASILRVTGLSGMPRTTGIQMQSAGYTRSASGAVNPGDIVTISFTVLHTASVSITRLIAWQDASHSDLSYSSDTAVVIPANTPARYSVTGPAPAGAAFANLISDIPSGLIISGVQIEKAASPSAYNDGDSAGWTWDGTAGNSSSVMPGSITATVGSAALGGALAGVLPALSGQLPAVTGSKGVLGGVITSLGGSFAGTGVGAALAGLVRGTLPVVSGQLTNYFEVVLGNPNELRVQRKNTKRFIDADPTQVKLNWRTTWRTATGGYTYADGGVRPVQIFKLIMQSPAGGSIEQRTEDGTERQVDYILLGEWNAAVAVGDWWEDALGNRWEVRAIVPQNGYEIRAVVEAHGKVLEGG